MMNIKLGLLISVLAFLATAQTGTCAFGDEDATIDLIFKDAQVTRANLGGKAQPGEPEEIYYMGIDTMPDGRNVNMRVITTTPESYNCQNCEDVKSEFMGKINMFSTDMEVVFSFVDDQDQPIKMDILYFTMYDIDGTTEDAIETITFYDTAGYVLSPNTALTPVVDGNAVTFSSLKDTNIDNPTNPDTLTEEQQNYAVTAIYRDMDSFRVRMGVSLATSRNMFFSGISRSMINLCRSCSSLGQCNGSGVLNVLLQCYDGQTDNCNEDYCCDDAPPGTTCQLPGAQDGYSVTNSASLTGCTAEAGGCDNASVTGVQCSAGYSGTATVVQCTTDNLVSVLAGCVADTTTTTAAVTTTTTTTTSVCKDSDNNNLDCGTSCGDNICDGNGFCVSPLENPCVENAGCDGKACADSCLRGDILGYCDTDTGDCVYNLPPCANPVVPNAKAIPTYPSTSGYQLTYDVTNPNPNGRLYHTLVPVDAPTPTIDDIMSCTNQACCGSFQQIDSVMRTAFVPCDLAAGSYNLYAVTDSDSNGADKAFANDGVAQVVVVDGGSTGDAIVKVLPHSPSSSGYRLTYDFVGADTTTILYYVCIPATDPRPSLDTMQSCEGLDCCYQLSPSVDTLMDTVDVACALSPGEYLVYTATDIDGSGAVVTFNNDGRGTSLSFSNNGQSIISIAETVPHTPTASTWQLTYDFLEPNPDGQLYYTLLPANGGTPARPEMPDVMSCNAQSCCGTVPGTSDLSMRTSTINCDLTPGVYHLYAVTDTNRNGGDARWANSGRPVEMVYSDSTGDNSGGSNGSGGSGDPNALPVAKTMPHTPRATGFNLSFDITNPRTNGRLYYCLVPTDSAQPTSEEVRTCSGSAQFCCNSIQQTSNEMMNTIPVYCNLIPGTYNFYSVLDTDSQGADIAFANDGIPITLTYIGDDTGGSVTSTTAPAPGVMKTFVLSGTYDDLAVGRHSTTLISSFSLASGVPVGDISVQSTSAGIQFSCSTSIDLTSPYIEETLLNSLCGYAQVVAELPLTNQCNSCSRYKSASTCHGLVMTMTEEYEPPEAGEAPEAPEAPEMGEAPEAPEAPEMGEAPEAPEAPEAGEPVLNQTPYFGEFEAEDAVMCIWNAMTNVCHFYVEDAEACEDYIPGNPCLPPCVMLDGQCILISMHVLQKSQSGDHTYKHPEGWAFVAGASISLLLGVCGFLWSIYRKKSSELSIPLDVYTLDRP